jgi:hypothetical protein
MKLLINGKSRKIMYNETDKYYYKCKDGKVDASKYFLKGDNVGSLTEGSLKKQCRKMLVGGDSSIIQILENIVEFLLKKIPSHNKELTEALQAAVTSLSGSGNYVKAPDDNSTLECDTKLELIKLIVCGAS